MLVRKGLVFTGPFLYVMLISPRLRLTFLKKSSTNAEIIRQKFLHLEDRSYI